MSGWEEASDWARTDWFREASLAMAVTSPSAQVKIVNVVGDSWFDGNPPGPYDRAFRPWPTNRPPAGWDVTWFQDAGEPYPRAWLWVVGALDNTEGRGDGLWSSSRHNVYRGGPGPSIVELGRDARAMAAELEALRDRCMDALEAEPERMLLPIDERFVDVEGWR